MNNLNSVLIEGGLKADPDLGGEPIEHVCSFTVECHRQVKNEAGVAKSVVLVPVVARGRLAEVCGEYLKKGRGVRVVGRLVRAAVSVHPGTDPKGHDEPIGELIIEAEHVEFKPQLKKERASEGASL